MYRFQMRGIEGSWNTPRKQMFGLAHDHWPDFKLLKLVV